MTVKLAGRAGSRCLFVPGKMFTLIRDDDDDDVGGGEGAAPRESFGDAMRLHPTPNHTHAHTLSITAAAKLLVALCLVCLFIEVV